MYGGGSSYRQDHGGPHAHKSGHKRREKELTREPSNPAVGTIIFESAPLPQTTRMPTAHRDTSMTSVKPPTLNTRPPGMCSLTQCGDVCVVAFFATSTFRSHGCFAKLNGQCL